MFKARIENWQVLGVGFAQTECIFGRAYDHADGHADGVFIRTSPIVEIKGNVARTESGSLYRLGKPQTDSNGR